MRQSTFSDNGFEKFRKKTRKEQFLDEMEVIIPWQDLTSAIEPFYPQPEMHQTRKGNQWYFGMKAHIGVDSHTKLIHSVVATAANVHDSQVLGDLLHGNETRVWGDSAYTGQQQVLAEKAPAAQDFTQTKGSRNRQLTEEDRNRNRNKSRVRAKVEHQFAVIKRQFGFSKVRYRGLAKNAHRLFVACALSNLVMAKKSLMKRRRWEVQAS